MTEPTTSELMRIVQQMAEDSKEHRQELKATIAGMTANPQFATIELGAATDTTLSRERAVDDKYLSYIKKAQEGLNL